MPTTRRVVAVLAVLAVVAVALLGVVTSTPTAGAATNSELVIAAASQNFVDDVVAGLQLTGGYTTVDDQNYENGGGVTPTILANYDAVVVMADQSWPDPVALGDLLADYVDAGGRVVETVFTLYCELNGSGLEGRWASRGYGALVGNVTCEQLSDGPLGITPVVPGSPFLTGGLGFDGGTSSYRNTVDLGTGATLVATWTDGLDTPFMAYKAVGTGFVVGLNFYPPSSDARPDFWTAGSGGWELLVNALGVGGPAPTTTTEAPTTTAAVEPAVVTPAFTG